MKLTNAGDFTVKPDWTLGPRVLDDYELVYFPSASQTRYRNEQATYLISEPTFILTLPGEQHDYHFDPHEPTRHWFFHFETESLPRDALPEALRNVQSSIIHSEYRATVIPILMKQMMVLSHLRPSCWQERAQTLLAAVLSEFAALGDREATDLKPAMSTGVSQALAYMDEHAHRCDLTIAQVAALSGWSHAHFTRQFVEETGASPRDKLREIRVERACQWLLHKHISIKEIAYRCGFEDEHYFSRVFSKLKGMTASAYRRKYATGERYHLAPVDTTGGEYPRNHYFLYE